MDKNKKIQWEKDFLEFLNTAPSPVPNPLTQLVLKKMTHLMNPSPWTVFSKVVQVHFFVGFLTLLFCPQFGVSITSQLGLMPYLMHYGHEVCMLGCGAVFTGFSVFTASWILKPEEIKALKANSLLQFFVLTSLSIGFFIALGAKIIFTLGLFWMVGAVLGAIFTLDIGWLMRLYMQRKMDL